MNKWVDDLIWSSQTSCKIIRKTNFVEAKGRFCLFEALSLAPSTALGPQKLVLENTCWLVVATVVLQMRELNTEKLTDWPKDLEFLLKVEWKYKPIVLKFDVPFDNLF